MAGEIKQMMFGDKGNTQIIGIPHDKFIKEMQRKDAEIARLTDELTSALKQTQDTGTQNDLQARLQVLQRERHAFKTACAIQIGHIRNICNVAHSWRRYWKILRSDRRFGKTVSVQP